MATRLGFRRKVEADLKDCDALYSCRQSAFIHEALIAAGNCVEPFA